MAGPFRWFAVTLALVLGACGIGLAAPAWACGCGAYIPDGGDAAIATERALVAWDGTTEDIVMSFDVTGSSERAAWIMPVPNAARVSLGDEALFRALADVTAPRIEHSTSWWPSLDFQLFGLGSAQEAAGAPRGVNMLAQQRIGPFDVTRLTAQDAGALAKWLGDNGFPNPAGLHDNLEPYLAQRWELVAIKLAPADDTGELTGSLQPLRLSFAADAPVYPMRLSRSATVPQTVVLYVVADHRMDPSDLPVPAAAPTLEFAGRIPSVADAHPALRPYLERGTYLTQWTNDIADPSVIVGDYGFVRADADTDFQQVVYVTKDRGWITTTLIVVAVGAAVLLALVVVVIRSVLRRGRRQPLSR